jgi:hypothetical protein
MEENECGMKSGNHGTIVTALLVFLMVFPLNSRQAFAAAPEPDTAFNRQFRREIGGWIAADATYSILLPDGKTLWLFGDTFLGKVNPDNSIVPGAKMIRNSAVIQEGDSLRTLYGGTAASPSDFIPTDNPDSTWYWPEHGLVYDDTLRIFAVNFRKDPDAPPGFQFAFAGNDMASFTWPGLSFIHARPVAAHAVNGVYYGPRILADSAWYYIYGRRDESEGSNLPYAHVARAPLEGLMGPWEYFNGSGWDIDPASSVPMHDQPVSQQFCVSTYLGKYILLSQEIWLSAKIYTYTSNSPSGPWSNKKLIYTTPETSGDVFTYNAYAHPQFDHDRELLVSYNVNGDFFSIFSNVEIYRPRFIRVPYMNLDYDFWAPVNVPGIGSPDPGPGITAYPNPFSDRVHFPLELPVAGRVVVELYDSQGRLLDLYLDEYLLAGTHRKDLVTGDLPGGLYYYKIRFGDKSYGGYLIKTE